MERERAIGGGGGGKVSPGLKTTSLRSQGSRQEAFSEERELRHFRDQL